MHAQRKGQRGDLIPVILAAFVAVVGQTVILFDDFGPPVGRYPGCGRDRLARAASFRPYARWVESIGLESALLWHALDATHEGCPDLP